jgi:DNA mismatch repair protein MSH6
LQRIKRKISVQDLDDSDSAPTKAPGRAKKRRLSRPPSEEPEENEEVAIGKKAFTEKLQKFKKSPQKKVPCMRFLTPQSSRPLLITYTDKKRKPTSDDDDFIVPDDASDSDAASIPSENDRRSTSRSSARSVSGLSSDEGEEDEAPKPKKKTAPKPAGKSQASNLAAPSSSPFLTAAERSMQDKKLEKKNVEKPFGFLRDIKDKDGVRPGEPGYDPRTIFIPKSSWTEFTPFEKQVGLYRFVW